MSDKGPFPPDDALPSFMLSLDQDIREQLSYQGHAVGVLQELLMNTDGLEPARQQKAAAELAKLRQVTFRFQRMTANIRETARFLRGEEVIEPRWIDFTDLCRHVCGDVNTILDRKAVILHAQVNELYIDGDRQMLERVLYNLISNALLHSEQDEAIHCELGIKDGCACVAVSGGRSVPETMVDRLFDGFTRQRELDELSDSGLALGLTLCRYIIESHDGTLLFRSFPEGPCAGFSLPLGEKDPDESEHDGFVLSSDVAYTGGYKQGLIELSGLPLGTGLY